MKNYLESVLKQFKYYEGLGRYTMEQIDEKSLFYEPAENTNSIAIIVKHLHGNMLSRWTDFLNSDGEKEWRKRDEEFESTLSNRKEVYQLWNEGWECLYNAIEPLKPAQLDHVIYIRNEGHTVMEAINRQLCHYTYHVGQIVLLGKIVTGANWVSLSIPKGKSTDYNKVKFSKDKSRKHFTEDVNVKE
ncbi:DUF1572 family protein [Roseivirga seohaensis]|uniref:DUF1572 family protein n=1 Tax=Roseivirga seohaensis TaxID=1914963 RepID=UPI003BA8790D